MNPKRPIEAKQPRFEEALIRRISLWVVAVLIALCGTVGLTAAETNAVPDVPGGSVVNVSESPLTEKAEEFREKGYVVEGVGEQHPPKSSGDPVRLIKFKYTQKGGKWKLQVGHPDFYRFGYDEQGYDGTNIYFVAYMNHLPLEDAREAAESGDTNSHFVFVQAKIIPSVNYPIIFPPLRAIWEGCASITPEVMNDLGGCAFSNVSYKECKDDKLKKYILKYSLDPDTGLLESATSFNLFDYKDNNEWQRQVEYYRVNNNMEDKEIPISNFRWDYIVDNEVAWYIIYKIEKYGPAPKNFDPRPEIQDRMGVLDYRPTEVDRLDYHYLSVGNTNWLSTNSPRYKAMLAEAINKQIKKERKSLWYGLYIGLVAVIFILIIYIIKPWRRFSIK